MALQTATVGWARPLLRPVPVRHAYRRPCLLVPARPARGRCIPTRCSAAAIGAGFSQQTKAKVADNPFSSLLSWFDVGVAEVDKKRPTAPSLKRTLALVAELVSKETKLLGVAAVFMVLAASFELAIPHFTSKAIYAVTSGTSHQQFKHYVAMLGAFALGYGSCAAIRGALFSIIQNRLSRQLRYRLFGVLIREESSFHDVNEAGQLTSRLTSDCYAICRCVSTNVNVALRNGLQVIGGTAILMGLSRELTSMCLAVFGFHWAVTVLYGSYSRYSQRVAQDLLAHSTACAEEAFMSSRVVRTFGTEQTEQDRYAGWLGKLYAVGVRQAAAWGLYVVAGISAQYSCIVLSLLIGSSMVAAGVLTPEKLTSYMFYVPLITHASVQVCDQYGAIMEAIGASERVMAHLDDPPAPQIASGPILNNGEWDGGMSFEGVTYRYPTRPDVSAVTNVTLDIAAGRLTALVGGSGSGKSTLVSLLQRLADPTEGSVKLAGHDLRDLDAAWFRSKIGVVSQEPKLFSMSVSDNIRYGCTAARTQEEVAAAAKQANAHDFIMNLPQGYDTLVTDKMLSGGQRQRIALARALVRKPALLLLDEATSALDAESEAQVQAALDRVMKDRSQATTVLVIAHRLSTVKNADHIVVLDKGQVSEQGTHQELLALTGIYYHLVKRQSQGWTKEDRDLSPMRREPPMMSSFEEYDQVLPASSTVSSLGNASLSLSSLQDSQMGPSEGRVGKAQMMAAARGSGGVVGVGAGLGEGGQGRWVHVEEAAPFQQPQHQQRGRTLTRKDRGSLGRKESDELVLQGEGEILQEQQQHHRQVFEAVGSAGNSPRGRAAVMLEERGVAAVAAAAAEHVRRQGSLQNDIVPMPKVLGSERTGVVSLSAVAAGPLEVVVGATAVQEEAVQNHAADSTSDSSKSPLPSPCSNGSKSPLASPRSGPQSPVPGSPCTL